MQIGIRLIKVNICLNKWGLPIVPIYSTGFVIIEDQISSVLHPHFHVSELLNKHLTLPLIYRDIALCMYGPENNYSTLTLANVLQLQSSLCI